MGPASSAQAQPAGTQAGNQWPQDKLGIVKPKATHHHRLPLMAWSMFLKSLLESAKDWAD